MNKILFLDFNDTMFYSRRRDGLIYDVADAVPVDGLPVALDYFDELFDFIFIATNQPNDKAAEVAIELLNDLSISLQIDLKPLICWPNEYKPDPAVIQNILNAPVYNASLLDSWIIGDKWSDVLCGHLAGIHTAKVGKFGYERDGKAVVPKEMFEGFMTPDLYVPDLWTLASWMYCTLS